jgi:carbamoyl-phosphate synthase large subunit
MPDVKKMKVLVIGSGPTTIGLAGECDQGVLDACRTLAARGCTLLTVDANPDAVFNGGPWSSHAFTEPLTPSTIETLIEYEQPDAILSLFGGRVGLHLVSKLYQSDILVKNKVSVWGPSKKCIEGVQDRDTLQSALAPIGLKTPSILPANGVDDAVKKAQELGFPIVLRCDDAQVLPDGLIIYNQDDLTRIGATLSAELSCKMSVEASLLEWRQIDLEVLRDHTGKSTLVGAVEYLDTAGVHPGDSVAVSPAQTLSDSQASTLAKHAQTITEHLDIVGNATVRFAYLPDGHDLLVLAVHPRYTTSTALVARITGIPMAKLSTLLATGLALDPSTSELSLSTSPDEPTKMVGVKWPCWDFSRLKPTKDRLGLQMQATGHHVGYGDSFQEALQKAARAAVGNDGGIASEADKWDPTPLASLLPRLATPSSRRLFELYAALRKGAAVDEICRLTHMAPWFMEQLKTLVDTEQQLKTYRGQTPDTNVIRQAKIQGFSRIDIARALNSPIEKTGKLLSETGLAKKWKPMPGRQQHQRYSTNVSGTGSLSPTGKPQSVVLLGNGAYGIGNGAECDYGIVHAARTLNDMGYAPILINSNIACAAHALSPPMTCYNGPLTASEITDIVQSEKPVGVMVQFAGTAAGALSKTLSSLGCRLLGTPIETLLLQQNKTKFKEQIRRLGIPQPTSGSARAPSKVSQTAGRIGFPVVVSGPASGSAQIIQDPPSLEAFLSQTAPDSGTLWIEQLLEYAIEAQAEVLCDGQNSYVVAVMEHIELAGVHGGDSAAVIPPYSIAPRHMETISEYCHKISTSLGVKGLLNIRFGIYRDTVYLLETNNNVSRNLAVVSKTLNIPLVEWTSRLLLGESIDALGIDDSTARQQCSVRAPVFPFNVFSTVDPLLGPNMRSTGQVMALADNFGMAYFKALEASGTPLPTQGTVLITVTDEDKSSILEPARIFSELGFKILATKGTHKVLAEHGITSTLVRKLGFGRPNLVDEIKNGNVQMVINTPTGGQGQIDDSVIRKAAIRCRVVNITTPASALAAAKGIAAALQQKG